MVGVRARFDVVAGEEASPTPSGLEHFESLRCIDFALDSCWSSSRRKKSVAFLSVHPHAAQHSIDPSLPLAEQFDPSRYSSAKVDIEERARARLDTACRKRLGSAGTRPHTTPKQPSSSAMARLYHRRGCVRPCQEGRLPRKWPSYRWWSRKTLGADESGRGSVISSAQV